MTLGAREAGVGVVQARCSDLPDTADVVLSLSHTHTLSLFQSKGSEGRA